MTLRRRIDPDDCGDSTERGFGGFLRSLLSGIPWSERATGEERIGLAAPASHPVRVHNTNGRTRVIGEERSDIEMIVAKTARAESADAARDGSVGLGRERARGRGGNPRARPRQVDEWLGEDQRRDR